MSSIITTRETLEFARFELGAHTDNPTRGFSTPLFATHARVADPDNFSGKYSDYVYFGGNNDVRNYPIDACGRISWNADNRILAVWYWRQSGLFRGIFISSAGDAFALDQAIESKEVFNGFSMLSTDRDTTLVIGQVKVSANRGLQVKPVDIDVSEPQVDRIVNTFLDTVIQRKIQELTPANDDILKPCIKESYLNFQVNSYPENTTQA